MQIEQALIEDHLLSAMHAFPRVRTVYDATTQSDGDTSVMLRQNIISYALNPTDENLETLPVTLRDYVRKVVLTSHKVTDRDITDLGTAGFSEDFLYEVTVTASLGAGLQRFQAGMHAIHSSEGA